MPFKPSLVALPVDPTAYPYLGFPLTEIVLEQPSPSNEGAALPALPTPDARDKITESVQGSDVRVNCRKLTDVELDIDFIDAAKKAEIERLYHDGRSVYLSPNFGPDTMWSFPLQRTTNDFTGNKTMSTVRACKNYEWDATDKVFRTFDNNEPSIVLNGKWERYFRSHSANANYATKPHPDSTSHGWVAGLGSPVITYTEDIKTPLLSNRGVTNAKGIVLVAAPVGASISTVVHTSTASLSTTQTVAGSLCIAWKGQITVGLQDVGGAVVYDSTTITGDGAFQLIRLSGANSNASNDAEIQVSFVETTTETQLAMIGPVNICSGGSSVPGRFPDWNDATITTDITSETDTVENLLSELTVSFFFQWSGNENGFTQIGGTPNINIKTFATGSMVIGLTAGNTTFTNVGTEFSLSDGDWVHCVVTLGGNGRNLYINGQAHTLNGTFTAWNPEHYDESLTLGYYAGFALDSSGLSHVRADRREWTALEVIDHYDTYFKDFGRGIIEPAYGKEMIIDTMEWVPRPGDKNNQWLGRIVLRELGIEENFAGMQTQEGTL